ncbi:MAG: undecaprenyl-diphosphate phosphatase [Candidatus Bathyarchaeota archaeon]|nr:undecaprenyl-diphosphate phosphatase [Candidatus Bathyarchaeota archaeon]
MQTVTQSILIGLLQGLLEWLPVSSEGNMVLVLVALFGLPAEETVSTAIFLHLGTGFAALFYFRDEVIRILLGKTPEYADLRAKLFIMTLLTGLVGFPIFMWLNISVSYGETLLALTGLALIATGMLQREAEKKEQTGAEFSWPLSIVLGSAQGLAIIPGLSRSGLTTSIMLFRNFTGEEAFRISFLMSIPASFAAAFGMMLVDGFTPDMYSALSAVIAGIVGYLAIDALLKLARRISFWKICVGMGAIAVIAWLPTLLF